MFPPAPPLPYEPRPPARSKPRLSVLISWAVIALVVIGLLVLGTVRNSSRTPAAGPNVRETMQFDLMAKYTLGTGKLGGSEMHAALLKNLDDLAKEDTLRIKVATVAGELAGKDAAVERLAPLSANPDAAEFLAVYRDGTPLTEPTRQKYAPYSDLAGAIGKPDDHPAKAPLLASAKRVVLALAGITIVGILLALVALGLFITAIVLLSLGKIRLSVGPPVGPAHSYVEGFAIYLGLFLLGGIGLNLVWPDAPLAFHALPLVLAVGLAAVWPLIRGGSFAAMRQDWGIHLGRNPFLEVLAGLGGYLAGLPIVVLGIVTSVGLAKLADFEMGHPIQSEMTKNAMAVALLAVVFAPISEELLFRGVFLAHLRTRLGPIFAGLLSAFVFAAIHPQGWPAIPMLGSIGFVLAMIRQWRGSLIAPIAAHAFNNGVVVAISLLLLS